MSSCSLWGPGGGERVAHVALRGASGWDPTDGFDSQGGAASVDGAGARPRVVNRSSHPHDLRFPRTKERNGHFVS